MKLNDIIDLESNPLILIAGSQNSGKTYLIRELIREYGYLYDQILVLSGTEFNREIVEGIDHKRVKILGFSHYDSETRKVTNRGEELLESIISFHHTLRTQNVPFRTLLICEDWIGSIKQDSPQMLLLARASRWYGITCILSVQKVKSCVSTAIRGNAAVSILFNSLSKAEMEGISDVCNEPFYSNNPSCLIHDIRTILTQDYSFCLLSKKNRKVYFCAPIKEECRIELKERSSFKRSLEMGLRRL